MGEWIKEEKEFYHWSSAEQTLYCWVENSDKENLDLNESFQSETMVLFFCKKPLQASISETAEVFLKTEKRNGVAFLPEDSKNFRNWAFLNWKPKEKQKIVRENFVYRDWNFEFRIGKGTSIEAAEEQLRFSGFWSVHLVSDFFRKGTEAVLHMDAGNAGCFSMKTKEWLLPEKLSMIYAAKENAQELAYIEMRPFGTFYPKQKEQERKLACLCFQAEAQKLLEIQLPEGETETFVNQLFGRNIRVKLEAESFASTEKAPLSVRGGCRYYLAPSGSFAVCDSKKKRIPCGNSGVEYMEFTTASFVFLSGQPSCVMDGVLCGQGTMPYVSAESAMYYSQSQQSRFFKMNGVQNYMEFLPIPYAQMEASLGIPVFWEDAVICGKEKGQEIETFVLSAVRNQILSSGKQNWCTDGTETMEAFSEKGLLIKYTSESMSQNEFLQVMFSDSFWFSSVRGVLKRALQSQNPIILLDSAKQMQEWMDLSTGGRHINLDGWGFDLSMERGESQGLFFVLKYTSSCSLKEAIAQPQYVTLAEKSGLQKLRQMMEEVEEKKEGEQAFSDLYDILHEKDWCGVLAFHVPLQMDEVPKQVRMVISGIKHAVPSAYYLAFGVRKAGEDANVDGLLYYKAPPEVLVFQETEYDFRTEGLAGVFKNGKLVDFSADSSLYLKSLFQTRVLSANGRRGNELLFQGKMVETEEGIDYVFALKEPLWYKSCDGVITTAGILEGRLFQNNKNCFVLEGVLQFAKFELDIFSYGEGQEGLYFHNYVILADENGNYAVDLQQVQWNKSKSRIREGSLLSQFPISFKGFVFPQNKEIFPKNLGYTGIYTEGLTQGELTEAWKGMQWELSIGEFGALSAYADYKIELLTAYSSAEYSYTQEGDVAEGMPALYVGASAMDAFPIQGIMKLDFCRLEIRKEKEQYYVFLRGVLLRVLGMELPSGSCDLYFLGDGTAASVQHRPAWYAAYEGSK